MKSNASYFSELKYGQVTITAAHQPTEDEVIKAIDNGKGTYHDSEVTDVFLDTAEPHREKNAHER